MDDVADLVHAEHLLDAAALARGRGEFVRAADLYERACSYRLAAECASAAGNPARALILAVTGRADDTAAAAIAVLGESAAEAAGDTLTAMREHAWAARAFEAANARTKAAKAWEDAGDPIRAARLHAAEGRGDSLVRAGKVLEAGLRRDPSRADLRLALGDVLLQAGKPTAALRVLQAIAEDAPEKSEALPLVARALGELGMNDARAEVVGNFPSGEARAEGAAGVRQDFRRTERVAAGEPPAPLPTAPARADGEEKEGQTGARLYGRFEVVRQVSSTATARVFECVDVIRGDRVALKLFAASERATRGAGRDALAHFLREARVLARLHHPNVVPLRDLFEQGPAVALEWMPGGTLTERLLSEHFTPSRAASVATALLVALGEGHRLGVVHRDVKPDNVLFDASGTPRLSDFGVAHLGDLSVTATAGSFGSFAYMSPEQREGRPATARSDVFSAGVVLFEMLTGLRSNVAARDDETLDPPLRAVHRHLGSEHDAIVARLLARDPERRPSDAFTAARAIEGVAWPRDLDDTRRAALAPRAPSVHPPALRLEILGESPYGVQHAHDRWLDQNVELVPLTPATFALAAAFARAGHRSLQTVLRVDREAGLIWLASRGEALPRSPLDAGNYAILRRALASLHATGAAHGSVTRDNVRANDEGPQLLLPAKPTLRALQRVTAPRSLPWQP